MAKKKKPNKNRANGNCWTIRGIVTRTHSITCHTRASTPVERTPTHSLPRRAARQQCWWQSPQSILRIRSSNARVELSWLAACWQHFAIGLIVHRRAFLRALLQPSGKWLSPLPFKYGSMHWAKLECGWKFKLTNLYLICLFWQIIYFSYI